MIPREQKSYRIRVLIDAQDFNGSMLPKNNPFDAGVTELDENGHNEQ